MNIDSFKYNNNKKQFCYQKNNIISKKYLLDNATNDPTKLKIIN